MAFYLRLSLILIIGLIIFPSALAQSEPTTDPLVQVGKERTVKCGRSAINHR